MAKPEERDQALSDIRFPGSPSSTSGPGPVTVRGGTEIPAEPELPEHATDQPIGQWPYERQPGQQPHDRDYGRRYAERNRRVENVGETVGSVIGNVVQKARQIPAAVQDRVQDLKSRFTVISGRGKRELTEDLKERAGDLAGTAQQQARRLQTRAQFYSREYPLQFIAGAAATGFAVGFLLRMWRDE